MKEKILTKLFDIYFYLFHGCCSNCKNHFICRKLKSARCSFMENNEYPNYYIINKHCYEYQYRKKKFMEKHLKNKKAAIKDNCD